MDRFLSIVADVFDIAGRGCVIVPGIPLDSSLHVQIRDAIRFVRPDGSTFETYVAGIEMINSSKPHPIPILLPLEFKKSDVPVGTKVFVRDNHS